MPHPHATQSAHDSIRRVLTEGFSARDIAEPLISFDALTPASEVQAALTNHDFDVAGVRQHGLVVGYLRRDDLSDGPCGNHLQPFTETEVLPDTAGIAAVVQVLADRPCVFVKVFGSVGGIVTRDDLQKPPVRMWLFGFITVIEMGLLRLIDKFLPNDSWKTYLSEGRLAKAEALLEERRRRQQSLSLLDCLQFSDKGDIVLKHPELRDHIGVESRRRGGETVRSLEALRNNLAHGQDIVSCDWDTIVQLSQNIDRVLAIRA